MAARQVTLSRYGQTMAAIPGFTHPRVAVIFGGVGPEHGVSCLSARSITSALVDLGFPVTCIGISPEGVWRKVAVEDVLSFSVVDNVLPFVSSDGHPVQLSMDPTLPGFHVDREFISCRVAFPIVHGVGGEDGQLQGVLDSAGISYVGSGVEASAISMNKVTTKRVVQSSGVGGGTWIEVTPATSPREVSSLAAELGSDAYFVKPASGGSSAGITKVSASSDLREAIRAAFSVSDRVIIEAAISQPRELEVAVLDVGGSLSASPVGEIRLHPDFEFYDFTAKYLAHGAELVVPADLDPEIANEIRTRAIDIFRLLGCRDYARVDFFLDKDSTIIFNEINTAPGFTDISMYSRMWEAGGISFADLVHQLVANAGARSTSTPEAGS